MVNEEKRIEDGELVRCRLIGQASRVSAIKLVKQASAQGDGRWALLHHDGQSSRRMHQLAGKIHWKDANDLAVVRLLPTLGVRIWIVRNAGQRGNDFFRIVHLLPLWIRGPKS